MTRFIYLADTHSGADPMGYAMQPGYPERLPELVAALEEWLVENPVDFVLHGGDMVDAGTQENIAAAVELFDLSVPVYLCLGNHDVTEEDSLDQWQTRAARMLPDRAPTYSIESDGCVVHVAPNQWEEGVPFIWRQQQQAHLLDEQLEYLSRALAQRTDDSHIVLTHSPVLGLPVEQTGYDEPYHAPPEAFTAQVLDLVETHPNIRCVLGAHSHMHMHVEHDGVHYVTTSSWSEAPFEFKVFEVDAAGVRWSTRWLGQRVSFEYDYDYDRAFVQGRACDRAFPGS